MIDELANFIREIDGGNTMGAGELAERIVLWLHMKYPPDWIHAPPRSCITPTHEAADAFWKSWRENGETHKHGYYESTWMSINAALDCGFTTPENDNGPK